MVWDTRWPPFWVVDTSSRSALVLRLQSPQVPKVPQLLKVFTLRAGDGGRRRGPHAPHCERVGRGIINSIEPAICRAQTNPGSKALAKHHGTQHRARDAKPAGAGEPDDRSEVHQQRQARGARRLHDRPPARARSALQPRPLQHWPQFPAPNPCRQICPRKVPAPTQRPTRWKEKGRPLLSSRGSRASRRASPARHASGSLRSPRFSRARRSSSRGPQPLGTRGRETREGFPAGAAPGWAGRDRAA